MPDLMSILGSQRGHLSYDTESGYAFASVNLTAKLAGVQQSNLTTQLHSDVSATTTKLLKFLSAKGFQGYLLLDGLVRHDVIHAVVEYYAMHAGRYCNAQAKAVFGMFAEIGLVVAIKSTLGVAVDDRTTVEPSVPQVVIEQPEVTINIGAAPNSHHAHLTPLQSHLDEVARLRERIKKQYNTAEEQEEKAAALAVIKQESLAFFATLMATPKLKSAEPDLATTASDDLFADLDRWVADPDITDFCRRGRARKVDIVKYRYAHQAASPTVIGKKFGVSNATVTLACNTLGYWQLPGVVLSRAKAAGV